jgi:hypothetical protein
VDIIGDYINGTNKYPYPKVPNQKNKEKKIIGRLDEKR